MWYCGFWVGFREVESGEELVRWYWVRYKALFVYEDAEKEVAERESGVEDRDKDKELRNY